MKKYDYTSIIIVCTFFFRFTLLKEFLQSWSYQLIEIRILFPFDQIDFSINIPSICTEEWFFLMEILSPFWPPYYTSFTIG